ncbi:carbohydrate ABC transporter permease [Lachnoclostridium sp. Marseille-P6806]|uniref:carbohydrate ABC transporter permease n=1 Tax=Lachnoclostridium sp. Marseille-P6806 TaxID=2364793 RepID=UPI0010311098|nr:carbohydrate ABC transporter permease [Lachnoclostridium sp. Marseille-P6806]
MKKRKRITPGTVLLYLTLSALVFMCLYPFLNVVSYSLSGYNAVLSGRVTFFPMDFTLEAYRQILGKVQIWTAMRVTVFVTLMGTLCGLVPTIIAAYALSRRDLPGRKIMAGLILFTMYFSGGIIPTFLVVKRLGMYDHLTALYIPQAINVFNFIVMRTFFRQLPESLEEAAKIDGASDIGVLTRIILPLSVPIIATIGLFYAVQYWNGYFDALLYIQSPDKYTLQLRLRSLLFADELNNAGANTEGIGTQVMTQSLKMACVTVSTIPILVVYPWLQKYFVKGVMLGSVKG